MKYFFDNRIFRVGPGGEVLKGMQRKREWSGRTDAVLNFIEKSNTLRFNNLPRQKIILNPLLAGLNR